MLASDPTKFPLKVFTKGNQVEKSACWIQTYTGAHVNPFNPDPETIHIEDIAHALAHISRFAGQTRKSYSVAEHSLRLVQLVPYEKKLTALLHDAAEAYLGDMARPVKKCMPEYAIVEKTLRDFILRKFGAEPIGDCPVAYYDGLITYAEAWAHLGPEFGEVAKDSFVPADFAQREPILCGSFGETPLTAQEAEMLFLVTFDVLTSGENKRNSEVACEPASSCACSACEVL